MPRQLLIDDHIEMRGEALHRQNMEGNWQEEKYHDYDRFTGIALDATNRWAVEASLGTADTIAISEVQGGEVKMTMGTGDNDSEMIATAIIYSADYNAETEWRVLIEDVTQTALFVGFSDAKVEVNTKIAIDYPDGTVRYTASNAVGFVIDADKSTSSIMCCSVKGGIATTPVDTGVDWADGEIRDLRVKLDVDGNATFYINGVSVAYIASAVTEDTLLCSTVQAMTRAATGGKLVRLKRFDAWQDE